MVWPPGSHLCLLRTFPKWTEWWSCEVVAASVGTGCTRCTTGAQRGCYMLTTPKSQFFIESGTKEPCFEFWVFLLRRKVMESLPHANCFIFNPQGKRIKRSCVLLSYARGKRDSGRFSPLPEEAGLVKIELGGESASLGILSPCPFLYTTLYLALARKVPYTFGHWFLLRWKVILFH